MDQATEGLRLLIIAKGRDKALLGHFGLTSDVVSQRRTDPGTWCGIPGRLYCQHNQGRIETNDP